LRTKQGTRTVFGRWVFVSESHQLPIQTLEIEPRTLTQGSYPTAEFALRTQEFGVLNSGFLKFRKTLSYDKTRDLSQSHHHHRRALPSVSIHDPSSTFSAQVALTPMVTPHLTHRSPPQHFCKPITSRVSGRLGGVFDLDSLSGVANGHIMRHVVFRCFWVSLTVPLHNCR